MAKGQYSFDTDKERKVAQLLREKGAKVKHATHSKSAADLTVQFVTGTTWDVQVKSYRKPGVAFRSGRDIERLMRSADMRGTTPVIAEVTPDGITYRSARSGRRLTPRGRRGK